MATATNETTVTLTLSMEEAKVIRHALSWVQGTDNIAGGIADALYRAGETSSVAVYRNVYKAGSFGLARATHEPDVNPWDTPDTDEPPF